MKPNSLASDVVAFVLWFSLLVGAINAVVAAIYIFPLPEDSRFTEEQLRYFLTALIMLIDVVPLFWTFFFKREFYVFSLSLSGIAALCFTATSYAKHDLQGVWLWGPWLLMNIVSASVLWKNRIDQQNQAALTPTEPGPEPYGRIYYDRFIVPIETERLLHSTRVYFASTKDQDWIANGMIVTLNDAAEIAALEFISKDLGIARWSSSTVGTTTQWEEPASGRGKWKAALSMPVAKQGLDRKVVIDVLRLIENPDLRRTIDNCLNGQPTKWDPKFHTAPSAPNFA